MTASRQKNFTDYDIQALIDGELPPEQEKEVRTFILMDSVAKEKYIKWKQQKEQLRNWWQQQQNKLNS